MTQSSTKTNNNRGLTLAGANRLFEVIGIKIARHDLGHYHCSYQGKAYAQPTLTALCQELIKGHMPTDQTSDQSLKTA